MQRFQTDWKEFGLAPEIEHHSEFMARHQERLPRANTFDKIVYHDPLLSGRKAYRGTYDEPREVLARSGEVIDPPRSRERSFCCGAGGGLAFLGEESGERISHYIARAGIGGYRRERGAVRLVPFCNTDVSRRAGRGD